MKLNIKQKLFLIVIIPTIALLLSGLNLGYSDYNAIKSNEKLLLKAELIRESSKLVHDLYLERELSSAYFNINTQEYFREELKVKRKITNLDIEIFKLKNIDCLESISQEFLNSSKKFISQLVFVREQIERHDMSSDEGYTFYTNFTTVLLELINSLSLQSNTQTKTSYILSIQKLLKLQALAGQERAFVTRLLDHDDISDKDRYEIRNSIKEQKKESQYIKIILEDTIYAKEIQTIEKKYVSAWLERFLLSPKEWFIVSTNRIEDINNLEKRIFSEILLNIKDEQNSLKYNLFVKLFGTLLVLIILFFTSLNLSNKIGNSLKKLDEGIQKFFNFLHFKSELPSPIDTESNDEINSMAQNINKEMLSINEDLNEDADFIHEATEIVKLMQDGDFSERPYFEPKNPNLQELKEVLNNLMELLSGKIKEQTTSLERLNSSLEDKVYHQTLELQNQVLTVTQARDEALQAQVVKDEFLANMSHEIRTPLNAILGFVSILKKQIKEEKAQNYLKIIDTSGKSLLTIINDILDFSKIQSGKFVIDKHPVHPVDEFSNAVVLFTSKAYEKDIGYVVFIDPNLPETINVDSVRIKQILSNLLSNAFKFTPLYGEVKVSIIYRDNQLIIAVRDTGIGISKENQSKVFSAFSQADGSTTRNYGGTGLGLSISANLAALMNGTLTLESEEKKGSTFTLSVPADIIDENDLELANTQKFSHLKFAVLSNCKSCESSVKLIKKYLNAFGIRSILSLNSYQKDGYDVLFFIPDEEYNEYVIESKKASIAMLRSDLIKLGDIEHIEPLYAPFLPKHVINALNNSGLKNIAEMESAPTEKTDKEEAQFKGKVLIAEDNKTNQMLIKLLLMDYGVNFKIANDGLEAVAMFKKDKFDMVLMDENMPNLNGIEAMLQIKEYEKENSLSTTPVVALTASALDSDRERFTKAGMDGFIAKPIDTNLLELELEKYLAKRTL